MVQTNTGPSPRRLGFMTRVTNKNVNYSTKRGHNGLEVRSRYIQRPTPKTTVATTVLRG